jgi:hypothetical protein
LRQNVAVATSRISTEDPDLSPVLGELGDETAAKLSGELSSADARLTALVETLNERGGNGFASQGVVLESELSGQTMIRVLLEDAKGSVGFSAELRPKNFYGDEDHPWQPGRPPMVMETDGWDVGGEVTVRFKTRVQGRPYTIQEQVLELSDERYETAEEAVAAFAALCTRIEQLALSREPTLGGWKPEIPESVGGPPVA